MHICLITSGRPTEIFYGGEEKFTVSFGNWLSDQGNDVTILGRKLFGVVAINPKDLNRNKPEDRSTQPHVIRLPYLIFTLALLTTSLMLILKILAINQKSRISILHAQDTGYGGLSGIVAAKLLRIPVLVSSHGLRYNTMRQNFKGVSKFFLSVELSMDYLVARKADLILTVSSAEKTFFTELGTKKEKVLTIPVGIKTSNFKFNEAQRQRVRTQLGIQNEILLGFVGRLSAEKNLFTLLEAFSKAIKQSINAKLLVVGTGPLEDKLKVISHNYGLANRIIFAGARTDVNKFLSALDIFVLPSYTEGCPTALLEAMSSGKAIIASNIPSIRDILQDGSEAILINPYDVRELQRAILSLSYDSDLRAKFCDIVKKKVEQYDVSAVYPRISNIYEKLMHMKECKDFPLDANENSIMS